MNDQFIHYVYAYIDPRTNIPFYIGKGQHDRYKRHLTDSKNPNKFGSYKYFYRTINKIRRETCKDPVAIKIAENLSVDSAYGYEELAIAALGRKLYDANGVLTNIDPGGKGSRGAKRPQWVCDAIGRGLRGRKASQAEIEANRRGHLAENLKPETRQKLSVAATGINNKAALRCTLKNPNGEIITTDLLLNFCEDNNIAYHLISESLKSGQPVPPSKYKPNERRANSIGWQLLEKVPVRDLI